MADNPETFSSYLPFANHYQRKAPNLHLTRPSNWHPWVLWALLVTLVRLGTCQFGSQCEEIKIPMCRNMPYNLTRLPNLLHHSTQENAQLAVDQFELLRWTRCSDQLEFFLCAMYAPICTREFLSEAIPPCRSVCESARRGCEPLLARFDIPWPANLECSSLPLYDRGVCITPEAIISSESAPRPEIIDDPCECGTERKLRQRLYKARRFNYVIRATVKSVDTFGGLTLSTVTVTDVIRTGRVMLLAGMDAHLWTNRSCECPSLIPNNDYLIMGWEDAANSRLLYVEGSLAVLYKKRFVRKIKTWDASMQPPLEPATTVSTRPSQNVSPHLYPHSMHAPNTKKETKRRRDRGNNKKKGRKKGRRKNRRKKMKGKNRTEGLTESYEDEIKTRNK